jgi:hypothetical protein
MVKAPVAKILEPVQVVHDAVVVTGGMLGKNNVVLSLVSEGGRMFWPIKVASSEACLLLTGERRSLCPLTGLRILKDIKTAIAEARRKPQEGDEPAEDLWGDGESSVCTKAPKRATQPILTITVEGHTFDVLNNNREIIIEFTTANLSWLTKAVQAERPA